MTHIFQRAFWRVVRLVSRRTGFAGGATYLYFSYIGLITSWSLYAEFGIDPFSYADLHNFLFAALAFPTYSSYEIISFVMICFGLVLFKMLAEAPEEVERLREEAKEAERDYKGKPELAHPLLVNPFRKTLKSIQDLSERADDRKGRAGYIVLLTTIVIASLTTYSAWKKGKEKAEGVVAGGSSEVVYEGSTDTSRDTLKTIGRMGNHTFFYDPESSETRVIPDSRLISLTTQHDSVE